jgi:hypothetical protein
VYPSRKAYRLATDNGTDAIARFDSVPHHPQNDGIRGHLGVRRQRREREQREGRQESAPADADDRSVARL